MGSESVVELVREQFRRVGRPSDVIFSEIDREGLQIENGVRTGSECWKAERE